MSQTYPVSLNQISLQQRVEWENTYGRELKATALEISKIADSGEKTVAEFEYLADSACKSYSFFTGIDLEVIRNNYEVRQVINVYVSTLSVLLDEEQSIVIQPQYQWKGDSWILQEPTNELGSEGMNWQQFQINKQIIKDLMALADGDWSVVANLCALYLRKQGESINDIMAIIVERKELFKSLTLDIVMAVARHLQNATALFLTEISEYQPTT